MGKSHSKVDTNDSRNLKKLTTRRLKLGIKFGKDVDGGIEAGLACGYEKKTNRLFDTTTETQNEKCQSPKTEERSS